MSIDIGASVAVVKDGKILLIKRADVDAWALPGGVVEAGESTAEAAIREVQEETGLEVELTRLVGIYFLPRGLTGDHHNVLYAAKPVGGMLKPQPGEVVEEGFFSPDALPEPLIWWHEQRIRDVMSGVGGSVVWTQNVVWPAGCTTRKELYELIANSGLSKREFSIKHFSRPDTEPSKLEIQIVKGKSDEINEIRTQSP